MLYRMGEGRPRVLYFTHGHPNLIRGGAEQAALELYAGVREHGAFEPFLAARTGDLALQRPGTPFGAVDGDDPNQLVFYAHLRGDENFFQTMRNKRFYTYHLAQLLKAIQPDVVHFQHTVHFGVEAIRQVRVTLPHVPIVYTLHEYIPICHAQGQMVRTKTFELCDHASPQRCHGCFPERAPSDFLLREHTIKRQFQDVDKFVAPSRFLLERFVAWGIPREKLVEIDYGREPQEPVPPRPVRADGKRNRFGFFGQMNPFKGIRELLLAANLLRDAGRMDIHLDVSGANLDLQTEDFQHAMHELMEAAPPTVGFLGPYAPEDLSERIASVDWVIIPSIWWENSPLVIQEAFMHERPVICSNLGGMAEKVTDGLNGLHFRARDPSSLAETLTRAADTDGLWEELRQGIPKIPTATEAAETHAVLYGELRDARSGAERVATLA